MKPLRIAQLVLPWISLPPMGYAGTERIVYHLTEELVRRGHQVTLFASGDSHTSATLESVIPKALGLQGKVIETMQTSFYPLMHVAKAYEMADQFDIIHSHAQFLSLPFSAACKTPVVHTFHRQFEFDTQEERDIVAAYGSKLLFTSISNAQRVDGVRFIDTVYNGVDTNAYVPSPTHPTRDYLFWAGRLTDKKGPEEAIKVAKHVKMNLVMAGEVTDMEYFEKKIRPHIDGVHVQLAQHENRDHIINLYQNAKVTIVPTKWNEPFGLVPVESMSCGTPAVSYDRGGVSETIAEGTGFLVNEAEGVDGLVRRVKQILDMSPDQYGDMSGSARTHVVDHFSIGAMTDGYERVYDRVVNKQV